MPEDTHTQQTYVRTYEYIHTGRMETFNNLKKCHCVQRVQGDWIKLENRAYYT